MSFQGLLRSRRCELGVGPSYGAVAFFFGPVTLARLVFVRNLYWKRDIWGRNIRPRPECRSRPLRRCDSLLHVGPLVEVSTYLELEKGRRLTVEDFVLDL